MTRWLEFLTVVKLWGFGIGFAEYRSAGDAQAGLAQDRNI